MTDHENHFTSVRRFPLTFDKGICNSGTLISIFKFKGTTGQRKGKICFTVFGILLPVKTVLLFFMPSHICILFKNVLMCMVSGIFLTLLILEFTLYLTP